jgi:hypothetical protein
VSVSRRGVLRLSLLGLLVACAAVVSPALVNADSSQPARPFRAILPAIAADAGSPAPAPAPSPLVVTRNVSTSDVSGFWVYGEVHNALDHTITDVMVTATLTAAPDSAPVTHTFQTRVHDIGPGGNGPFRISFTGPTSAATRLQTEVSSYRDVAGPAVTDAVSTTFSAPRPQEFVIFDPVTHKATILVSTDTYILEGTLTNHTDHALTALEVVVVIYDGDGNVAIVGLSSPIAVPYAGSGPAVLNPGQTGTYTVPLSIPAYLHIQGATRIVGYANATPVN